jgi:uncharacterized repeat protein (TIGR02543 family)
MMRRIVSFLLVISTLLTALPMDAFAASRSATASEMYSQQQWQNTSALVTGDTDRTADQKQEPGNKYIDVNKADWFYEDVMYVLENGIFNGTGEDTFSPGATLTRAMYVTVLGRIAGVDTSQYSASVFKDVAVGAWYAPYVAWAVEKGITEGTGEDTFSPDEAITREQMAKMTAAYFKSFNISYEAEGQITSEPKDVSAISFWALDSALSLWHAGLFTGDDAGNFNPTSNATRAEAAALCMRVSETVKRHAEKNQPIPPPATSKQSGKNDSGSSSNTYTLTFITNGGDTISSRRLEPGTVLDNLPTPYKMDAIFLGWYKDSGLSTPVSSTDTITGNMTLYAKYAASTGFTEVQSIPSVSKLDQNKTFTITVMDSTNEMTAGEVKVGMTFASPSNPDFAGIEVTKSGEDFIVSAKGGSFDEGGTFKLTLNNENLFFKGEDESTRIYNFTIARAPVMNVSLNKQMKYIPAEQVSDMTLSGTSVQSLSIPLVRVADGTDLSSVDPEEGTFVYEGGGIAVGDTVSIYEGIRPDLRDLNTSDDDAGDIAYVTITAISGTTYSYIKADEKSVLFTPDVLPVNTTADTDGSSNNNSITVSQSVMAYTDAKYADIGLNAATTVDIGDFIAFYTGTFGPNAESAGYAEITAVSISGDNYVIAYAATTLEQMSEAMALHTTREVDGDELLENVDIAALEASVEQQAIQSGFADEAAQYLAEMAMKTDSFKQLSLESIENTSSEGLSMLAAGNTPEVKNLRVNATVNSYLPHLGGSGARVTLTISCDIVFQAAGENNNIVIRLSGAFEQEVKVKLNVSSQTIWELINGWFWWAKDTLVTASIDIGAYTAININASIGTFEKGAEFDLGSVAGQFQDIGQQIKDIMDGKKPDNGVIADTLREKYKAMLEEDSDWVDIYKKEIFTFEQAIDPFHIVVFGMDINFVVGAKMNVSIGCNFSYQNEKRYIFSFYINARTATSDTIDLKPEQYDFKFYIMGTLGLRAGISVEIKVGLFSLDLASIGIEGEVGAYVQLWGYFYYEASYRKATGKISKYAGALYMEFGIYLEISFVAQAFDNTFEYEATLYENQWPLLTFGSQEDVYDFAYSVGDAPTAFMAKQTKSFVLPDSVFSMSYMDMKTGDTESKYYAPANFDYSIINSDFTYNPATKTVTVAPGEKDITEGTIALKWKGNPVAFTSIPVSRTLPLHWEDLKSAYTISFNSRGGSVVDAIALPYKGVITPPANPVKVGYVFSGWYKDEALTQSYAFPATMPAEDTVLYAKWEPASDTKFKVEHYKQNLENDLYTLAETENRTGITDTEVSVNPKSYEGFSVGTGQRFVRILADGSAVRVFLYKRNSYTATFQPNNGKINADVENTVKFGGKINTPIFTRARHSFAGWSPAIPETMPAQNTTFTAQWTTVGQVAYKVEHYKEGLDGIYTLAETENLTDVANQTVTATAKSYDGFSYNRIAPNTVASGIVIADGSLVLKLYYARGSYTLTFDANGGTGGFTRQAKFGESISAPAVTKEGYNLTGWSPAVPDTMPAADATYTAQWTADGQVNYKVEHYLQNLDDDYTLTEVQNLRGAEGDTVTASARNYTGFDYFAGAPTIASGTIASDGSLVLKLYYMRKNITLTFDAAGGSMGETESDYQYGRFSDEASPGTIEGYAFNGWSPAFTGITPAVDITYTAQWTANIIEALDVTTSVYATEDYTTVGVDWDCATKTLTLTNAAITAADSTESGSDNFALKVPDGATIILEGDNYLQSGKGAGGTNSYGVLCDGDLTIQGQGTLTALGTPNFMSLTGQNVCYGIYATGTVTIQSGATVIAKSTGATGDSCGISAGNVVITDSTVLASSIESANGICCGIYASGDIDVTNSIVNTPSGIYASGDVTIDQSTVNALNSSIEYPDNEFNYYGIYGNNVTITGGTVYITAQSAMGYGIYATEEVIITGSATVTARCADYGDPGTGSGIYAGTGSISISGSTVIAAGKDALAMNKVPVLDDAEASCASTSADGSDGVSYDPTDIATYRYVQILAN